MNSEKGPGASLARRRRALVDGSRITPAEARRFLAGRGRSDSLRKENRTYVHSLRSDEGNPDD